jgi:hypothetical protein
MREKILLISKAILILVVVVVMVLAIKPMENIAGKGGGGEGGKKKPPPPPPPPPTETADAICDVANNGANILNPNDDPDEDGLLNVEECLGLKTAPLSSHPEHPGDANIVYDGYIDRVHPSDPNSFLNPLLRTLFVTLVRAVNTNLTFSDQEAFDCISKDQGSGGLDITANVIPYATAQSLQAVGLWITPRKKMLWIQESVIAMPILGKCDNSWGTPKTIGKCWIYTRAIMEDIDAKCAGPKDPNSCQDTEGNSRPELYFNHFRNTICHECGHALKLRKLCVYETGCHHWPASDILLVSQFVDVRARTKAVTFYIADSYADPADMEDCIVWEP